MRKRTQLCFVPAITTRVSRQTTEDKLSTDSAPMRQSLTNGGSFRSGVTIASLPKTAAPSTEKQRGRLTCHRTACLAVFLFQEDALTVFNSRLVAGFALSCHTAMNSCAGLVFSLRAGRPTSGYVFPLHMLYLVSVFAPSPFSCLVSNRKRPAYASMSSSGYRCRTALFGSGSHPTIPRCVLGHQTTASGSRL